MADLCARLNRRGFVLALASSKPENMCRPICERFGFAPSLREIVGSPPDGDWDKARVIREAMSRLGLSDADRPAVLMTGDRRYDVEGARQCGLDCPGELRQAGAVAVVRSVEELERFFLAHGPG